MSKYDVKFKRLALLLLPTFLRRPLIAAVAYASVIPVQYLYVRFIRWKQDTDYRLNNNGQVCYLRAVLNDMLIRDCGALLFPILWTTSGLSRSTTGTRISKNCFLAGKAAGC